MEGTPQGDRLITPAAGDLAVRLVHETAHLADDGSFPGHQHPPVASTPDPFIRALELMALDQLGTQLPAPLYGNRRAMGAINGR